MDIPLPPHKTVPLSDASVSEVSAGSFCERLRLAIGDSSLRQFARTSGMSESAIRQYLTGRSEPSMSALICIAKTAGVCIDWLATGNGPMSIGPSEAGPGGLLTVHCDNNDYIRLPRHGITPHEAGDDLMFRAEWIRKEFGVAPSSLLLLRLQDDSMEPTIRQDALLLVDLTQHVSNDALYAILLNSTLMVKRIQLIVHDNAMHFQIISDNPSYKAQILPADAAAIQIVGRVVWSGHRR